MYEYYTCEFTTNFSSSPCVLIRIYTVYTTNFAAVTPLLKRSAIPMDFLLHDDMLGVLITM